MFRDISKKCSGSKKVLYESGSWGRIKNSEKMDLDPVLDLFPVQDPILELKTTGKSGQSGQSL
jgi:hypothetical protein